MRSLMFTLAALASFSGSVALAQAAAPEAGAMLVSSDGKRLGRIDRVVKARDGQPYAVSLILDSRFVQVPANTLTVGENGRVTTSLSRKEVGALR